LQVSNVLFTNWKQFQQPEFKNGFRVACRIYKENHLLMGPLNKTVGGSGVGTA